MGSSEPLIGHVISLLTSEIFCQTLEAVKAGSMRETELVSRMLMKPALRTRTPTT